MAKKTYTIYGRRPNSPANIVPLYFLLYTLFPSILYKKGPADRDISRATGELWLYFKKLLLVLA